jgi:hypothetical protein
LSVLAETISALPHTPPDHLFAASPLSMLLCDLTSQPCNFISVVGVNRMESRQMNMKVPMKDHEIAMSALNAMRVSCLAR